MWYGQRAFVRKMGGFLHVTDSKQSHLRFSNGEILLSTVYAPKTLIMGIEANQKLSPYIDM